MMKKLKLNALHFHAKEVLTRKQLKQVLGGSSNTTNEVCSSGPCTVYNTYDHLTYSGTCGYFGSGGLSVCECKTGLGYYDPSGVGSHCLID